MRVVVSASGKLTEPSRELAVADGPCQYRLVITDGKTKTRYLIDTGADLSVLPKSAVTRGKRLPTKDFKLYAANGPLIDTYGVILITLNIGLRRPFPWIFVNANVSQAILGADFIFHYSLLVDLRHRRLTDNVTKLDSIRDIVKTNQRAISSIDPTKDGPFKKLLEEFHDITIPENRKKWLIKFNTTSLRPHHLFLSQLDVTLANDSKPHAMSSITCLNTAFVNRRADRGRVLFTLFRRKIETGDLMVTIDV